MSVLTGSPKKQNQQRRAVSMATESLVNSLDNKVDYEGDAVMASTRSNSDNIRKSVPQSPPNAHAPRKSGESSFEFAFFFVRATFDLVRFTKCRCCFWKT